MTIMLAVLGASALVEFALFLVRPLWRLRPAVAIIAAGMAAFASGYLVAIRTDVFSILVLAISLYRILNMLRVAQGRMNQEYLRYASRRTSVILAAVQAVVLGFWWVWCRWHPQDKMLWAVVAAAQLVVAVILLASLLRTIKHTRWPRRAPNTPDSQLPTVTVAIPARNETDNLEQCLRQVITSDYPKLEVIVLDDSSQTRRTPDIIRSFAHDGVRFVQGETPSDIWLPKNQAYNLLTKQASGQYILFCGVDVRFGSQSIRQIINQMLAHKKDMISILPWRDKDLGNAFTQGVRYWWELVPPRRQLKKPPVLSTCWVAKRQMLLDAGGFAAVARSIAPEAHFAKVAAQSDGYSFVRATAASDIASVKKAGEQRATMLRTRYPQLHRRPENVLAASAAELLLLVLPFFCLVFGFWLGVPLPALGVSLATCVILTITYEKLIAVTRTGSWLSALLGLPAGMLYDIFILHRSMFQYEFSTVEWKGRDVAPPAMHVISRLPKID